MAIETTQSAMVHIALDEVVALHPVFVRSHVGVPIKACGPDERNKGPATGRWKIDLQGRLRVELRSRGCF